MAGDTVAKSDGAGEHDGVAIGIGRGVDEVVGRHVVGGIADRVGDVGYVGGDVRRVGDGLFFACQKEAKQRDDEKDRKDVQIVFHGGGV